MIIATTVRRSSESATSAGRPGGERIDPGIYDEASRLIMELADVIAELDRLPTAKAVLLEG